MLDGTIRHQQAMFKIKGLPIPCCLIERFLDKGSVLRMCSLQYDFHGRFVGWVVFENSKRFLCPDDLASGNPPAEAPRMTEPLSFRQVRLASMQLLFLQFQGVG